MHLNPFTVSHFPRLLLWAGIAAVAFMLPACTRSLTTGVPSEIPYATFASVPVEGFTTPNPTQPGALSTPGTDSLVTPQPSAKPSTTPSSGGAPNKDPLRLAVFNLSQGEVLNVRSKASVNGEIVATLNADARQIASTGKTETSDEINWIEIQLPDAQTGWVSGAFMVEEVPGETFCADARVGALLDQFVMAVRAQDGGALATLISPTHGLLINRAPGSGAVVAVRDAGEIAGLFRSEFEYEWGADVASGQAVTGSFKAKLLPELLDVLGASSTRFCNSLQVGQGLGATSAQIAWPYDYAALNFVALHRPAPEAQPMDWRTWVVGVDYVNNAPFVSLLLEYYWTP